MKKQIIYSLVIIMVVLMVASKMKVEAASKVETIKLDSAKKQMQVKCKYPLHCKMKLKFRLWMD
jgi:uncharacterized membrane protein